MEDHQHNKLSFVLFTVFSLLVLSVLVFTQSSHPSLKEISSDSDSFLTKIISPEIFYENQDLFVSLLNDMSVNRLGLGIQKIKTSKEYECWTYEGTPIESDDILNYDEIVAAMESLEISYLYLNHEAFVLEFSFGKTAIVYRESTPSDDEFGDWEQLNDNWYYVYFPYI